MVTLTITSCKRPDLFYKTIESFEKNCLDKDLITDVVWGDDHTSLEDVHKMRHFLMEKFQGKNVGGFTLQNELKGLASNLNTIWSIVKTKYIFHLEDDWEFIRSGHFIQDGIDIIEDTDHIKCVLVRGLTQHPLRFTKTKHLPYQECLQETSRVERPDNFHGYSLNPGVQDIEFYRQYGSFRNFGTEDTFGLRVYNDGFRTASLPDEYVKHIGETSSFNLNNTPR